MNKHVKGNNSMHRTFYKACDKYRHQIPFCYSRNGTKTRKHGFSHDTQSG